jgi:hypothetical protein
MCLIVQDVGTLGCRIVQDVETLGCRVAQVPLTKIESSNLAQNEVYSIQHYVIKFVIDLWPVGGLLHQ